MIAKLFSFVLIIYNWYIIGNRNNYLASKLFNLYRKYNLNIPLKNVREFKILHNAHIQEIIIAEKEKVKNISPKIINLSFDSFHIEYNLPIRKIRKYKNAIIFSNNSIIYDLINNTVIIEKLEIKEINIKSLLAERCIYRNNDKFIQYFPETKNVIYIKNAVSFIGHYSNHFGHFIMEYWEKFDHFKHFNNENITILIHENIDHNILEIIHEEQKKYKFDIYKIKLTDQVIVENYYTIDPPAYVTDGANYCSITDKIFRPELKTFISKKQCQDLYGEGKKYFLTRNGLRNITNYDEIHQFFIENGYESIETSNLTMQEKTKIFSQASYIVGPAGSSFFNCFLTPKDVKILALFNYEISFDNPMQNMLDDKSELYYLVGNEVDYQFYNSNYSISKNELEYYCKKLNFI
jgi:hypothetical protein